jgi:starch phosphorylase
VLNGLAPEDLAVELVLQPRGEADDANAQRIRFAAQGAAEDGRQRYALDLAPEHCGKLECRIRAYPTHPSLTHPFELGLMLWA